MVKQNTVFVKAIGNCYNGEVKYYKNQQNTNCKIQVTRCNNQINLKFQFSKQKL